MARTTVSPITDLAPASRRARALASSVAPVVNTSSTSKPPRLSTWLPGRVAKAPCTDSQGSSKLSTCVSGRARVRTSSNALCGKRSLLANGLESRAADCIPARVLVRDVVVLEPPRLRRSHCPQRSLFQPAGLQSTPPAAQSARISAAESPPRPRFPTMQNYAPSRRHTFCPGKRGRAAAAPTPDSIRAAAAHKPRIRSRAHVQAMKGILRIAEPGWRSSPACRRCGIRKERIHRRPHN